MDEFPKALTNVNGEQINVLDEEGEIAAADDGYFFGGPKPAKAGKSEPAKAAS